MRRLLDKQFYRVNFGQGLDTKSDPKVLSSGKMVTLQNAQFTVTNRLSKRNGFSAYGTTGSVAVSRLATFQSTLIGWGDPGGTLPRSLYTYSQSITTPTFAAASPAFNDCSVSNRVIAANEFGVSGGDSATVNGHTLYAWTAQTAASSRRVYYKIADSTGAVVVQETAQSSTSFSAATVRCVAAGGFLLLGYDDGNGNLTLKSFDTANAYASVTTSFTGSTPTSITSGQAISCWDMSSHTVSATNLVFVSYRSGAKALTFAKCGSSGAVISTTAYTASITINVVANVSPQPSTTSAKFRCIFSDVSGFINYLPMDTSLVLGTATATAVAITTSDPMTLIGQELSGLASSQIFQMASPEPYSSAQCWISQYSINSSGTFSAANAFIQRGLCIQSKPIYSSDTSIYFWGVHTSNLQGQQQLVHWCSPSGFSNIFVPAARTLVGNAMGDGCLPGATPLQPYAPVNVNNLGSNKYASTCISVGVSFLGTLVQLGSLAESTVDFSFTNAFHTAALNGQTVIAGGFNAIYDGVGVSELGFFMYPEGYTASVTTSGGNLTPGLYQYVCVYEWLDGQGVVHQSQTGVPLSVTISATSSAVTLTIPTLRTTLKQSAYNGRLNANVAIYRDTVNASPTVFYRVNTQQTLLANDPTVNSITYTDTSSDATIAANPAIYTQGGLADNYTIDGTSVLAANATQLFAADPTNNGIVRIGKQYTPTLGLAFFSGITALLPSADGPITAMLWMDNSLIIFKARSIYFMSGQGPTDNGQNNQLSQIQLLTDQVGCDGPHAACLYPDGILFKSAKGYYRLGRDLSFGPENYIGREVEGFNSSSCLRAICVPDLNRCRFALSDNATILEYDYLFRQWGAIVTSVNDMATVGGSFYLASHTPTVGALVGLETVGTFVDALLSPTGIPFTIKTGWFALNQLQGCQRVFRVRFLGDFKSTHSVTVQIAYDFESSFTDTFTLTSANIIAKNSNDGATTAAYQFEVFPTRQKCESLQIQISDGTPTGESFDLTDMEIELGILPGRRFPLAATKAGS